MDVNSNLLWEKFQATSEVPRIRMFSVLLTISHLSLHCLLDSFLRKLKTEIWDDTRRDQL